MLWTDSLQRTYLPLRKPKKPSFAWTYMLLCAQHRRPSSVKCQVCVDLRRLSGRRKTRLTYCVGCGAGAAMSSTWKQSVDSLHSTRDTKFTKMQHNYSKWIISTVQKCYKYMNTVLVTAKINNIVLTHKYTESDVIQIFYVKSCQLVYLYS
jgi:hypothetical protein